jgi:hypothetical protein
VNKFTRLTDPLEVLNHWEKLFLPGMLALNDPRGAKAEYTPESFYKLLQNVTGMRDKGLVLMMTSKNDKPLGFAIAFETLDWMGERCMYLVEIFNSGKYQNGAIDMITYVENYARGLGLKEVKAATRRINGGGLRLFERKWGFVREYLTFKKEL